MTFPYRPMFLCSLVSTLALISTLLQPESGNAASWTTPALSRIQRHQVTASPNRIIAASPTQTAPSETIAGYPLANGTTVALQYGWQIEPASGKVFFHSGIDLLAPVGTPVEAIAPGIVVFAKDQGSYGKLVIINHLGGYQSRYAQLETINVTLGQNIKKGDILGTVGTTGIPTSQEPHLHFEMRFNGLLGWEARDPKAFLKN